MLQLGQTSKAFEHLGNALTYDPSNVKVKVFHFASYYTSCICNQALDT